MDQQFSVRTITEGGTPVICMAGRIDSSNAAGAEEMIRAAVQPVESLPWVLDAGEMTYLSSAGLRLLLSLGKRTGRRLTVRNTPPQIYEIFSLTGFTEIMDVRKSLREISVEGCRILGRGAVGTVYVLDEDTVVKVYGIPDCLPMIEREQKRAKQALVRGIPTAIPYDVVRVGEKYGAVFEMVKADNFNELIIRSPGRLDEIIRMYAELLNTVHGVEMAPGEVPETRDVYLGYLPEIAEMVPERVRGGMRELLEALPPDCHAVHGDIQMKNVMLSGDEPLLIDMETLSTGNPVFEFAALWIAYRAFSEDDPENSMAFMGIDQETSERIYRQTLALCLEGRSGEEIRQAQERIELLGSVRFLYLLKILPLQRPELTETRIRRTLERMERLLGRVTDLRI